MALQLVCETNIVSARSTTLRKLPATLFNDDDAVALHASSSACLSSKLNKPPQRSLEKSNKRKHK